ncbi:predicted protein [Uncinocarpus reesii 1704]|uniref:Uncharacterized protein n=1 Tax=Uncinocarpus reesii (strain UAMH 1704) TaxID=336963 RepID=C4JY53_UNCRE|nr:uncharacterized protein UREG_07104 [Uncinocarpus reesii 1704]EEP82239.1 predicted protein [Uncinocarpus reesii 1704]
MRNFRKTYVSIFSCCHAPIYWCRCVSWDFAWWLWCCVDFFGWQKKLSSLGVAHFPWDPAPQPPPPPPQQAPIPPPPVTVPSNAPRTSPPPQQEFPEQISQPQPSAGNGHNPGDVRVKTEPGYNNANPISNPTAAAHIAQQRAADALQQRYGAAAASQIHQLQAQSQAALSLPGQQRFQPGQFPAGQSQDPKLPPHQAPQPVGHSQTDGADDSGSDPLTEWKAEVARRREAAEQNGANADRVMREYVEIKGRQMEGNGLLAPLRDRYPRANGKQRKDAIKENPTLSALVAAEAPATPRQANGYDGVDDYGIKKDEDEDAINSDLDDPDDPLDDPEGDDAVGQVMLCTYDKVQRVKSKWKCTLKDGILTTGGKEYVFHKGNGEFEWF